MPRTYGEAMRKRMCEDVKGKTVESMEYVDDEGEFGPYWVITFTDGTEISFRFMGELV
jgi:hypothetical protein